MPAIKLTAFTGEQPKILSRLLPDSASTSAVNVRLDNGGLTPMNQAVQVGKAENKAHKTIFRHKSDWLSWAGIVYAVQGAIAEDRLYFTGEGVPKVKIDGVVYPLAVKRPETALTAALSGTGEGDTFSRLYAYTYVTKFGEESEPSPVSNLLDMKQGQAVKLTGFKAPPAGRNITKQRIYRTQTGQSGTNLYFLTERDATASDFTDNIAADKFGEVLPSVSWNTPPDELNGIISMPNGMIAGFVGRSLYFCEPYRHHAWPEKYVLKTDAEIVGLGALGTTLIILTKGQPYLASGSTPADMQMVKLEANFPCVNARGIVDMGFAIAYPSNEGLVAVTAQGGVTMVSASILSRESWLDLSPETIVGGQIFGRYVAFYDTENVLGDRYAGAVFLDIGQTPYLIRANDIATATFYDVEKSALYFLKNGSDDIYRLDSPDGSQREFFWRSKDYNMPYPMSYGALQIDTDVIVSPRELENYKKAVQQTIEQNRVKLKQATNFGEINSAPLNVMAFSGDDLIAMPRKAGMVSVGVYADGIKIAQITHTNQVVRLPVPPNGAASRWEVDATGNVTITQIVMATTVDELRQYL